LAEKENTESGGSRKNTEWIEMASLARY